MPTSAQKSKRVLRSIDTVLLLVDAQEGPMPQDFILLSKNPLKLA